VICLPDETRVWRGEPVPEPQAMHGFGDSVQYSVFVCELSDVEKELMLEKLVELLNRAHNHVLIVDLGEAGGNFTSTLEVLGKQLPTFPAESVEPH
jgi:CRISPR/Cas system-associated endoribonuclease Cas2